MRSVYEIPNFEDNLTELWNTVEPFYKELHAYVRRKLLQYYGSQYIRHNGPIPAHLLGIIFHFHIYIYILEAQN